MKRVDLHLLERLRELALVEVDVLIAREEDPAIAGQIVGAFVADLEDAIATARTVLRDAHNELGAGSDPLLLVDHGPQRRASAGDPAIHEVVARLAARAAARRDLARLDELVRGVLHRLLEADRRFLALGGGR